MSEATYKLSDVKMNNATVKALLNSKEVDAIVRSTLSKIAGIAENDARGMGYKDAEFDVVVDKHSAGTTIGHVYPNISGNRANNKSSCLLSAFMQAGE